MADFHPVYGGEWSPEPLLDGEPYPSMGFLASTWIAHRCALELDPWQVELLRRGMLYDPQTLDWVVRDVLVVGPEGMGKSTGWAALGCWYLDGPCLPPVEAPRPYPDPDIPVVSAALSLTEHIHRAMKQMIEAGPLAGRLTVEKKRIFRSDQPDSRVAFPAGSGAYQEGKNPRPAIFEEELHVLNAPGVKADGAETIEIVSSKRSKTPRPPVQRWTITNPDNGDPTSILGRRWIHAQRVLTGEVQDPHLLVVWYHAGEPWNLDDPEDLRRGIREAMPLASSDVEAIAAKYEKDRQSPGRFRRMSGGLFVSGDELVLPDGWQQRLTVPAELRTPPPPEIPVALIFDGARNRDSIALRGCTVEGYGWKVGGWERPPELKPAAYRYPRLRIHERVVEAMEVEHPKAVIGVDDTYFEDFADEWEDRWPGRVVRGYGAEGPAAWEQFRRAVLDSLEAVDEGREPTVTFDGDPTLDRHARNAHEIYNTRTKTAKLAKRRDDGNHPIDQLVTAAYALRLSQHLPAPENLAEWRAALGVGGG